MIRHIRGTVTTLTPTSAIIDVTGFGIEVYMAAPNLLSIGHDVTLVTHLALKQDGIELYGFLDPADRDFFELVLSVSGIGTKTALGVLRRSSREALQGAIGKRDLAYLTKIVGLGRKSAEKMLLELSEKVGTQSHDSADGEVFDTLVALGYTEREARRAVQAIPPDISGKDMRLKAALGGK